MNLQPGHRLAAELDMADVQRGTSKNPYFVLQFESQCRQRFNVINAKAVLYS